MTDMSSKIKKLRLQNNMTLQEVADIVGVGASTVRKWETGLIANMKRDKIAKLAEALQTTPAYLMGWEESVYTYDNIIPVPKSNRIPLLGTIACGEPILATENLDGEVDIPENIHADFALRCKGDSMIEARIMDGDIVYIRQQPTVDNGEIAAVLIGDEATLKRVYIADNKVTLMPCNPKYPPMVYTDSELEDVRIIGKAVSFTSRAE